MVDKPIIYYKKDCFNEPYCSLGKVIEQLDKLKQTLIEIKEIAENVQSFVDIRLEDDVYTEMDKILQKINECEVKND